MAWITENRRTETVERRSEPYLTDEIKKHLTEKYFPRYPNKRAVLLPALHQIQHTYNWIPGVESCKDGRRRKRCDHRWNRL